jgi:hypothetical protein
LIYHNPDLPTYEETRFSRRKRPDHATFLDKLDKAIDRYAV